MARYVAPIALAMLIGAIAVVVITWRAHSHVQLTEAPHALAPHGPPYWIVRPGDTYADIAQKTGLSVATLEQYNPHVDQFSLTPGERLNLWRHPPAPPPKPPLRKLWIVRPGDSFGLIAEKTGINLATLEQLNPQLKAATLQPGERVSLRH